MPRDERPYLKKDPILVAALAETWRAATPPSFHTLHRDIGIRIEIT